METMEDYSQLPQEIIEKIVEDHLNTIPQLVSFAGVCKSWRSAALELYNSRRHLHGVPSLLISKTSTPHPSPYVRRGGQHHHQFKPISTLFPPRPREWSPPYLATRRRMRLLNDDNDQTLADGEKDYDQLLGLGLGLGLESTEATVVVDLRKCHCIASKDGWLVLAVPHPPSSPLIIYLLNPVTGASIPLPPLDRFYDFLNMGKFCSVILSSSPDDDGCHAIFLDETEETVKVITCKVRGGRRWRFRYSLDLDDVECATYFGDKLYIVDYDDCLHVFSNLMNATNTAPIVTLYPFSSAMLSPYPDVCNLFELDGELIVVLRSFDEDDVLFQIYKLVRQSSSSAPPSDYRWEEVTSLDGYAVFLGTHQSLCVPVNDSGNYKMTVKGNHIYYVAYSCGHCDYDVDSDDEDWLHYSDDCGVYSLEHEKLVERSRCREKFHDYIWFSPMPWDFREDSKKQRMKHR
ncbi:hypothetical protein LINGRAHAP2_LOCUS9105 [Linum grandiflorum]